MAVIKLGNKFDHHETTFMPVQAKIPLTHLVQKLNKFETIEEHSAVNPCVATKYRTLTESESPLYSHFTASIEGTKFHTLSRTTSLTKKSTNTLKKLSLRRMSLSKVSIKKKTKVQLNHIPKVIVATPKNLGSLTEKQLVERKAKLFCTIMGLKDLIVKEYLGLNKINANPDQNPSFDPKAVKSLKKAFNNPNIAPYFLLDQLNSVAIKERSLEHTEEFVTITNALIAEFTQLGDVHFVDLMKNFITNNHNDKYILNELTWQAPSKATLAND